MTPYTAGALFLDAEGCVIRGFTITKFPIQGLILFGPGMKVSALNVINNGDTGIYTGPRAVDAEIGDTTSAAGRVCSSGNGLYGLLVQGAGSVVANFLAGYNCAEGSILSASQGDPLRDCSVERQNNNGAIAVYGENIKIGSQVRKTS